MIRVDGTAPYVYSQNGYKSENKNSLIKREELNEGSTYEHQISTMDTKYYAYVKEIATNTIWKKDYLRDLWNEKGTYLSNIRQETGTYGFDDIVAGATYAYSSLHDEMVNGYADGTRKKYVYDTENGDYRIMTEEEDMKKLNEGFDELMKWDQMVAKSRMETEKAKCKCKNKQNELPFNEEQVVDYIQDVYKGIRSQCGEHKSSAYEMNIGDTVSKLLNSNGDIHNYCLSLFRELGRG